MLFSIEKLHYVCGSVITPIGYLYFFNCNMESLHQGLGTSNYKIEWDQNDTEG